MKYLFFLLIITLSLHANEAQAIIKKLEKNMRGENMYQNSPNVSSFWMMEWSLKIAKYYLERVTSKARNTTLSLRQLQQLAHVTGHILRCFSKRSNHYEYL